MKKGGKPPRKVGDMLSKRERSRQEVEESRMEDFHTFLLVKVKMTRHNGHFHQKRIELDRGLYEKLPLLGEYTYNLRIY